MDLTKRQQVACCECGEACEYDPEYDRSPENTMCNECAEEDCIRREREAAEEAVSEAEWGFGLFTEEAIEGMRW